MCLGLLILVLMRVGSVLSEAELTLRTLVSGLRLTTKAVQEIAPTAKEIGRETCSAETALERLETLKARPPQPDG